MKQCSETDVVKSRRESRAVFLLFTSTSSGLLVALALGCILTCVLADSVLEKTEELTLVNWLR